MLLQVVSNQNLTPLSEDKTVYHLVLHSTDVLDYEVGDWLTVSCQNAPSLVDLFLQKMALTGDELFELRRVGQMPLREALLNYLELTQINPGILNKLQRQKGLDLWPDRQAMIDFVYGRDIVDLVDEFEWIKPLGMDFITLLSRLAPRYYSIASCAKTVGDKQVELVYKKVDYVSHQRQKHGVATQFMAQLAKGQTVEAEVMSNKNFKLPKIESTPIILLSAGVGVAPFIGFMQQRMQASMPTKNWLFYGDTHADTNFIFKDQWQKWVVQGGLKLTTAFSRDQAEKFYVQDALWENKDAVWAWIEQGAVLYICGSRAGFAKSIEAILKRIFTEVGYQEDASLFWQTLKDEHKLQMDVY